MANQLKDMHLCLLARLEVTPSPSLDAIMAMFDEYTELTDRLNTAPALAGNIELQTLNTRLLAALTGTSFAACMREAAAMRNA
jgi:hypothetical protein